MLTFEIEAAIAAARLVRLHCASLGPSWIYCPTPLCVRCSDGDDDTQAAMAVDFRELQSMAPATVPSAGAEIKSFGQMHVVQRGGKCSVGAHHFELPGDAGTLRPDHRGRARLWQRFPTPLASRRQVHELAVGCHLAVGRLSRWLPGLLAGCRLAAALVVRTAGRIGTY